MWICDHPFRQGAFCFAVHTKSLCQVIAHHVPHVLSSICCCYQTYLKKKKIQIHMNYKEKKDFEAQNDMLILTICAA